MLQWFDTLLGLVVLLLGASLLVMIFTQSVVVLLNLRGRNLVHGVRVLIENADPALKGYAAQIAQEALSHELVSDAWVKLQRLKPTATIRLNELQSILVKLADSNGKEWQQKLAGKLNEVESSITTWFDAVMDRGTQRFVAHTRTWTIAFSLILAVTLHLDALRYFEDIAGDAELRARLVLGAEAMQERAAAVLETDSLTPRDLARLDQLRVQAAGIRTDLREARLELIPQPYPGLFAYAFDRHLWGVLLMASLMSLGAPFWFNALRTLSTLRPILAGKEQQERKVRTSQTGLTRL
jgi:hypothetical protein